MGIVEPKYRKIKQTVVRNGESHLCPQNNRERWDVKYIVMDVSYVDMEEQWWELLDMDTENREDIEEASVVIHFCPFCGWKLPLNQHYYYPDEKK